MINDLITIDDLVSQTGTSRIHLAYLTKIGLLPPAVKRKMNGKIVGCYPNNCVDIINRIKSQKSEGITYSQLSKIQQPLAVLPPPSSDFVLHMKPSNFAYLVLGLVIGVLVSTLNTSGLAALNKTDNLPLSDRVEIGNQTGESNVYLIAVPKTSLDNLEKTNINYLIQN